MTVAASTRPAHGSALTRSRRDGNGARVSVSRTRAICAVSLLLGAFVHLNVGMSHAASNFATLSLLAAAAQFSLGLLIYLGRAGVVANAVVVLSLVLVQLYLLNVTVGLPPVIAHTHGGPDHVVWGYVFASPGAIDLAGVSEVITESVAVASAALLLRMHR